MQKHQVNGNTLLSIPMPRMLRVNLNFGSGKRFVRKCALIFKSHILNDLWENSLN
jgi:hypothetical protein